jgi:hypothetical protein
VGEIIYLEEFEMLEFDELLTLLKHMSQQELDKLQAFVLKKIKETQEDMLKINNLNFS